MKLSYIVKGLDLLFVNELGQFGLMIRISIHHDNPPAALQKSKSQLLKCFRKYSG